MKKSLIILIVAVFGTSACIAAVTSMNSVTKAQERKEARAQKQQEHIGELKAALAQQTFTFYPTSYTFPFKNPVLLNSGPQYYFDFYPKDVDIFVPFEIGQDPSSILDVSFQPYTDYTIKASTNPRDPYTYYITARMRSITNNNANLSMQTQDFNLALHLTVNVATGSASLILIPDFDAPVTYQGTIHD